MTETGGPTVAPSQRGEERQPVVLVPGGVNPAAISYGPLLDLIKEEARVVLKALEVYAVDAPVLNYSLELEKERMAAFVRANSREGSAPLAPPFRSTPIVDGKAARWRRGHASRLRGQ